MSVDRKMMKQKFIWLQAAVCTLPGKMPMTKNIDPRSDDKWMCQTIIYETNADQRLFTFFIALIIFPKSHFLFKASKVAAIRFAFVGSVLAPLIQLVK